MVQFDLKKIPISPGSGVVERCVDFPSRFVQPRHIDIWTPPGYNPNGDIRYPVIYMHDGQNLFDPATAFGGVDWGVADAAARLSAGGEINAPIIVGVWNTALRFREYMPQIIFEVSEDKEFRERVLKEAGGPPISDRYLKFLVYELKPWIDASYRTSADQSDTYVMGSSMGGMISLYAAVEYARVFSGAGCLSTHFPAGQESMVTYLLASLPKPGSSRFYFDYGTRGLDATYEPYQKRVDGVMQAAGYEPDRDWLTLKFDGADHSEASWRERIHRPLKFFLARDQQI